jgi:hypothetical protein
MPHSFLGRPLNIRAATGILAILALMDLFAVYPLSYWTGYHGESFWLPAANFCLWAIGVIAFFGIPVLWIRSLIRRADRLFTTAVLILLPLTVILFLRSVSPDRPFQLILKGARDRIARESSLDEFRHFARDLDNIPSPHKSLSGGKFFFSGELTHTTLKANYPFLGWGPGPRGFGRGPTVGEDNGVVSLIWGQAYDVNIALDGHNRNLPDPATYPSILLSPDIELRLAPQW